MNRIEEIEKALHEVEFGSDEWAELVIEATALVNRTTAKLLYDTSIEDIMEDGKDFIDGMRHGLDLAVEIMKKNEMMDMGVAQAYSLSRAVLTKRLKELNHGGTDRI